MSDGSSSIIDGLPLFFVYPRLPGSAALIEKECAYRLLELNPLREILEATLRINSQFQSLFPVSVPPVTCTKCSVFLAKTVVF